MLSRVSYVFLSFALVLAKCSIASNPAKKVYAHNVSKSPPAGKVCSPWYNCGEINWMCDKVPYDILECSNNETVSILTCNCASYNQDEDSLEFGSCLYNIFIHKNLNPYKALPQDKGKLNNEMCKGFNRKGTLCSRCDDGSHPMVYSFDMKCVKCSISVSSWLKFLLISFFPLTVFFFIILLFKINVSASYFHGFFYFSQAVTMPAIARVVVASESVRRTPFLNTTIRFVASLYGIWNLDFFRSIDLGICLETDMLQTLALELVVGVYPLILMLVSYCLIDLYDRNFRVIVVIWRPFRALFGLFHRNWEIKTSLIDAFATFFFLLNAKFLSVSYDLLTPVKLYQLNSSEDLSVSWRLFYNASIPYFGQTHLPYGILGVAVFLFFVLLPTLLLVVYPFSWFQKLLNTFPFRWYILHTFMDSYLACYKDGTQPGTRDYRWVASAFFIGRFTVLSISICTFNIMYFPLASTFTVLFVIALIHLEPFKESHSTTTNAIFLLLLCISYITITGLSVNNDIVALPILCAVSLVMFLPLLYVTTLTLHWMYSHRRFGLELIGRLRALRQGYQTLE